MKTHIKTATIVDFLLLYDEHTQITSTSKESFHKQHLLRRWNTKQYNLSGKEKKKRILILHQFEVINKVKISFNINILRGNSIFIMECRLNALKMTSAVGIHPQEKLSGNILWTCTLASEPSSLNLYNLRRDHRVYVTSKMQ